MILHLTDYICVYDTFLGTKVVRGQDKIVYIQIKPDVFFPREKKLLTLKTNSHLPYQDLNTKNDILRSKQSVTFSFIWTMDPVALVKAQASL